MNAEPAPPTHLVAGSDQLGRSCPYCRFPLKSGVQAVECGSCHALHHADCWGDNEGCAVMGCASAPGKRPHRSPPAPPPAPAPTPAFAGAMPPPPPLAAPRPMKPAPSPAELAQSVRSWLRTPTVTAILMAGLTALGVMAIVGLVVAAASPDTSTLGRAGTDGLFKEIVRDAIATSQARFGGSGYGYTFLPIVFAIVPVVGSAFGAFRSAHRTAGLPARRRLLVGAAAGVPLALGALLLSRLASSSFESFHPLSIALYCLGWGAIGGTLGAARAIGPGAVDSAFAGVPAWAGRWLRLLETTVRPLITVLLISGALGVVVGEVQAIRHQQSATFGHPQATAIIETPFRAGEFAIGDFALGTFTQLRAIPEDGFDGPLPPDDNANYSHFLRPYRIFAYSGAYPIYIYVFLLILLVAIPIAFAAYAGYATALAAGATNAGTATAYGALVGLVWALTMVLLRAIANPQLGYLVGPSLFVSTLLVTGAAGAFGGLLASRRRSPPTEAA